MQSRPHLSTCPPAADAAAAAAAALSPPLLLDETADDVADIDAAFCAPDAVPFPPLPTPPRPSRPPCCWPCCWCCPCCAQGSWPSNLTRRRQNSTNLTQPKSEYKK